MKIKTKIYKLIFEKVDVADPHHLQVICKLAYLLKFVCNPQNSVFRTLMVIHEHTWSSSAKTLSHLTHAVHAEIKQDKVLPSNFSSHAENKCCFLFSTMLFTFLYFVLVISLFKMAPMGGAEVQSSF